MKKTLAALLTALQVLGVLPIGALKAFAQHNVQVQLQQPGSSLGGVPVAAVSLNQGGAGIQPVSLSLGMNLPSLRLAPAAGQANTLQLPGAVFVSVPGSGVSAPVQTRANAQASAFVPRVGQALPAASRRNVSIESPSDADTLQAGTPEKGPAPDAKSGMAAARKALELPALKENAPSEASRGAIDTIFTALRGEGQAKAAQAELSQAPQVMGSLNAVVPGNRLSLTQTQEAPAQAAKTEVPAPRAAQTEARKSSWKGKALISAAVVAASLALPLLIPHASAVAAAGSITLSVIGIPQIISNFKAGKEGVKDLVLASPLIWFAAATLLSVVSIGQGSSLWWNVANLAGVAESAVVVGQINYYKRDAKALKATALTALGVLAPIPLIAVQAFMPLTAWVSVAFTAAMALLWVLNWPQIKQNYKLFKEEGRPPKGIAPLYPALVVAGSLMHLFGALVGLDLRWAMNAAIAILTAGTVLGQVYAPKAANAVVSPLVRLADAILPGKKAAPKREAPAEQAIPDAAMTKARAKIASLFEDHDLARFAETDPEARVEEILAKARALPGRSAIILQAPTAAGKSTLANGLGQALNGRIKTFSVDRYYKSEQDVPKDSKGQPEWDKPEALDLDRVAADIRDLLAGKRVELADHDMKTGIYTPKSGEFLQLGENDVVLVDSTYASHPKILAALEGRASLNIHLTAPTVVRLTRRLLRDTRERGTPPAVNLRWWGGVLKNERLHILPLGRYADVTLNLVSLAELTELTEKLARILAQEEVHGTDPETPRLLEEMVLASLAADEAR
ncbi:MAG: hypothetical protein AAB339_12935 [Elusimicrobiota bacterium]